MAKKKEEQQQASTQEQKASTQNKPISKDSITTMTENNNAPKQALVSEETMNQLSQEEKAAVELQEAHMSGQGVTGKKYKLSRSNTMYVDSESGWSLTGDEEKELPEMPSSELLARIKSGFIKEA